MQILTLLIVCHIRSEALVIGLPGLNSKKLDILGERPRNRDEGFQGLRQVFLKGRRITRRHLDNKTAQFRELVPLLLRETGASQREHVNLPLEAVPIDYIKSLRLQFVRFGRFFVCIHHRFYKGRAG
jgi:hypothetical protein